MNNENTKEKKPFNKKKLKYGAAATAITVIVIAIIVIVNLIAGILTEKKGLKLDLTKQKYFEISQETIDYIKNIEDDVEISVMTKKTELDSNTYGNIGKMIVESLAKYEQNSDHITVKYYDISENPDIISKYSANYNGEIDKNTIIVSNGDRVKVTSLNSMLSMDTSSYYTTGTYSYAFKGEQEITSAIMNVTDSHPVHIAFISKFNGQPIYYSDLEYEIQSFEKMLDDNGYTYEEVDMLTDELSPEKYDMAVLPAPVNDVTDDCIKKLEDFLYNNGNLNKNMIYIADVYQRKTPNIDAFLDVWGIKIGDNQIGESDESRLQVTNIFRDGIMTGTAPIVDIADSEYSDKLSNTRLTIVAPMSRDINLLFDANNDRTTKALLKSSAQSYIQPLNTQQQDSENNDESATEDTTEPATSFNPDTAEKGERVVMALATKETDNQTSNKLLVMGSATLTDPYIIESAVFNNAEFIINTVNTICDKEAQIVIAEKNIDNPAIDITSSQLSVMNKILIWGIPGIVLVCGIVVFVRRRNR